MRFTLNMVLATLMVALTVPAFAELQNVEVGGSIRIRGNWYSSEAVNAFTEAGNALPFVEQRSTVSVKADFTDDVTAFLELDSYEIWGTSFRDSYTGPGALNLDAADGSNNVDFYQAYIETRETFGYPVTTRIGRQEIVLGSEWLMGNNDTASFYTGLSYDGVTVNYAAETWNVTAVWAKVIETGAAEEDGDADVYALYSTFTGVEDWTIDAYWLFLRDGAADADPYGDVQNIHTFGLRGNGSYNAFDFEGEIAYQVGDATLTANTLGRRDNDYDAFGANLEVGYTFDVNYQPRVFLGFAWFEGEDNRDTLLNPFARNQSSISFNRLFSDWEYSEFLENTDLSNAIVLRGGVSAQVTEKVDVLLALAHFQADEAASTNGSWGGFPILLPMFVEQHDDTLGWEIGLYLNYAYSEDLSLKAGYAHFFADDGVDTYDFNLLGIRIPSLGGNFVSQNGEARLGGFDDQDADYVFVETSIKF